MEHVVGLLVMMIKCKDVKYLMHVLIYRVLQWKIANITVNAFQMVISALKKINVLTIRQKFHVHIMELMELVFGMVVFVDYKYVVMHQLRIA